jgi:hypothetical protein
MISLLFLGGCVWLFPDWFAPAPEIIAEEVVFAEEVVSKKISAAEGGVITVTEEMSPRIAGFELEMPAGALPTDSVITVNHVIAGAPPLPEGYVSLSHTIQMTAPTDLTLQRPATIRIPIPEGLRTLERGVWLKKYSPELGTWQKTPPHSCESKPKQTSSSHLSQEDMQGSF